MKNLLVIGIAFLFMFSCKEEELNRYEESKIHCRENMEFKCFDQLSDSYFKGNIDGEPFCVSDGILSYSMLNGIGEESVISTDSPVLAPGVTPQSTFFGFSFLPPVLDHWNGISLEYAPLVYLQTPSILDTTIFLSPEYIDRFIKEGDLVLRDQNTGKYDGFNFTISWMCVMLPSYDYYYQKDPLMIPSVGEMLSPSAGPQDNAIFRVSEFKKSVSPNLDFLIYDITFEISCDLYYSSSSKDNGYFGRLEDGIFKTQIVLPFEG